MTDGIHAVMLIQLNGMSSNAGGLLKVHEYIQPLRPIAPTIGTVKSCRFNTARSSNWRATGPSRSEAMLPVAQDCSSELIGFLQGNRARNERDPEGLGETADVRAPALLSEFVLPIRQLENAASGMS